VEDIRPAVVQILAQGSFRDPLEGQRSGGWTGSGFIIDPDGIVVTNNHVVTGAGAIKVRMDGGEEIPAQVLGVSECNDLAVLQLTDPGPYASLEWFDDPIAPPLEVYTAGFPLSDPEFTVTRGIVSKAEAEGRTNWASVRHVIEHDAAIHPGNSGGPLVSADGRVVGINYAGTDPGTGTIQFKAIAADLAVPVVDKLLGGDDETIGVNGQAVVSDDESLVGVWVYAVEPGTPASTTGVLAGDVITTLNGVPMSMGTMEAYCDVLRSAAPGQPISIQVIRFDTGEVWEGELNGTPMESRYSFANELADDVPDATVATAYEFETVIDDTGTLVVSVPTAWSQRATAPTDLGLGTGPLASIAAAPDLQAFYDTYDHSGVLMLGLPSGATELGTLDDFLGLAVPDDPTCASDGRTDYDDPVFVGRAEIWACGSGSIWVALAASPAGLPDAVIFIGVLAVTEADLDALDQVLYSFNFG
jgi:serine protease Do